MRNRLILTISGLVSIAGLMYAQEPAAVVQDSQNSARIDVTVLNVPLMVSVADNRGKLITNLVKEDFRIFEDDKPQAIRNFVRETDLPLSIALLVDSSGSVIEHIKFEQAAAIDFFFNTMKRRKDRAIVVGFDSVPRILSDFTADGFTDEPEKLAEAVRKIKAGGGTAVYDAVYGAVQQKLAREHGERRKLLILISDGDDTASKKSLTEALEMAQRHDTTIYAISTNKTSDTKSRAKVQGDDVIKKMVEETGGKAYFPLKLDDLASDFQKIGEELRSQYVISYAPVNQALDGTYRKVRVELVNKKHTVRTRLGYFASRGD
ncbi:MAG TPA: VWA domain-containing protein [Terriglobia bacterium]|nr:VWA domain-containing protein [Terriglobia bacterium]